MKKFMLFLIILLVCLKAFALDTATVNILVTINQPPELGGFVPADGYVISEGDTLHIEVTATDPNVLEYEYYINDEIKQPWSVNSTFDYLLGEGDIGLNNIYAKVRDSRTTVQTTPVEIFVFRGSPSTPE